MCEATQQIKLNPENFGKYTCHGTPIKSPMYDNKGVFVCDVAWQHQENCTFKTNNKAEALAHMEATGHSVAIHEVVFYCECGQAVRCRHRDGVWTHTGYKAMHEPYSEFLSRTNHPVKVVDQTEWQTKWLHHE